MVRHKEGSRIQDTRCRMEDAGWKMQDGRCRMEVPGSLNPRYVSWILYPVSLFAGSRIQDCRIQMGLDRRRTSNFERPTSNEKTEDK
ncbi:MAG: hypothetical protein CVU57_19340 [Deltaproteobacteria bacterium HGW-Deltaproteobacteria-15]|nr:MAG: hypothetical protein CVU57_19340 [Deltaproteobacteria bacterium HGW-Deltaproteobacteria-15]